MPAYVIVNVTVQDAATYDRYKLLAPPAIAAYGGRYIARGGATEVLEGSWAPKRLVLLEFPDADAARRWWSSEEYREAKAMRQASAGTDMVLVDGLPPEWVPPDA